MFKVNDDVEWPDEGMYLKAKTNIDEPESRNEGASLRYMTNRDRQMRGRIYGRL